MPFDEEEDQPSLQSQKVGLKNVSSQKSIFDSMPKKPSQEEFNKKIQKIQDNSQLYKNKTADLAVQFFKAMADKTLRQNKNMFQIDMENELLKNMVALAQEINLDSEEPESDGSLSLITILMKTCFNQRDKINRLEYAISLLDKKTNLTTLTDLISKEINKALDAQKKSE